MKKIVYDFEFNESIIIQFWKSYKLFNKRALSTFFSSEFFIFWKKINEKCKLAVFFFILRSLPLILLVYPTLSQMQHHSLKLTWTSGLAKLNSKPRPYIDAIRCKLFSPLFDGLRMWSRRGWVKISLARRSPTSQKTTTATTKTTIESGCPAAYPIHFVPIRTAFWVHSTTVNVPPPPRLARLSCLQCTRFPNKTNHILDTVNHCEWDDSHLPALSRCPALLKPRPLGYPTQIWTSIRI
jgi:hypothetical protein